MNTTQIRLQREKAWFSNLNQTSLLYAIFAQREGNRVLYFSLGDFVIHPDQPDWGLGQIQSIVGMNVTVNFEHVGKQMINCAVITLLKAPKPQKRT